MRADISDKVTKRDGLGILKTSGRVHNLDEWETRWLYSLKQMDVWHRQRGGATSGSFEANGPKLDDMLKPRVTFVA